MANFFQKVFSKNTEKIESKHPIKCFDNFFNSINKLNDLNTFISKKEYKKIIEPFVQKINEYAILREYGQLEDYCKNNNLNFAEIESAISLYSNLEQIIQKHNELFIEKELTQENEYLDKILKDDDPKVILDYEQRKVVINNEDYCLVIAGAGAGKTTAMAAKVKYLVDKRKIEPSKILVISYTNKAVNELKTRINENLKVPCPVTTFHACGNAIIRKTQEEKLKVASEGAIFYFVRNYISKNVHKDKNTLKNLILFFGYYIDAPYEGDNIEDFIESKKWADYSTLKSNLGEVNKEIINSRKKTKTTINNEIVKSYEEVLIANFLYLNGIDYEYEKSYPFHIPYSTKIYTPDFYINQNGKEFYLEHFGITESGKNTRYNDYQILRYLQQISHKISIHHNHKTNLLITYSSYNDNRPMLEHLEEVLINAGIKLNPRKEEEIYEKLTKLESNKYFDKLVKLICTFIVNFKTKDFHSQDFGSLKSSTHNVRTKLFLEICEKAYLEYERSLRENNMLDFEDMINESSRLLREVKELKQKLDFEYIIVDEYQDISRQRFNLTKELSTVTNAKIVAVGDDWQSIYAFAGSEISLFTKFKQEMGYADVLHITHTYRNSQELIDIAGSFVQENPNQIRKRLISPKSNAKPVLIYTYSDDMNSNKTKGKTGILYEKAKLLEQVLGEIINAYTEKSSILLIGRYSFDGMNLDRTEYFTYDEKSKKLTSNKYPNLNLVFMTAHSAKGLSFDNVVIINASNDIYGFPSQIENDPALSLVINYDRSYDFAEERRLFYVALTRTRNQVYILAPKLNPSKFVIELLNYDKVSVFGDICKEYKDLKKQDMKCPICGYPLQFKLNKTYGLPLYMCTNDPEICDFMSNNLNGGPNSIKVCPDCNGGFLIIRKNRKDDNYFLGCTNYDEGKGCQKTEALKF